MSKVVTMRGNKEAYEATMNNAKEIGGMVLVDLLVNLTSIDPDFQRIEHDNDKVNALIKNWDQNQLDPLKGVPHPEECLVSIVDGGHRLEAAKALGITHLPCMIVRDTPSDPKERKVFEAKLFLGQSPAIEMLKPVQMHKARILVGDEIAVTLDNLLTEYNLKVVSYKGRREVGIIGSYTRAYDIVKTNGEQGLRFIFDVCKEAGYNFEQDGYNSTILRALNKIYKAYGTSAKIVEKQMRPMKPSILKAKAVAKYPERGSGIALALYLQDYYVAKTGAVPKIDASGKIAS